MDTLQGLGAGLFVLLLLGAVLVLLRKRGVASFSFTVTDSRTPRRLQVMERASLGPRHSLFLVKLGEQQWLLATSPDGCQFQALTTGTPQP